MITDITVDVRDHPINHSTPILYIAVRTQEIRYMKYGENAD